MKGKWWYIQMLLLVGLTGFLFAFASQRNQARKVSGLHISFDDESTPFVTRETVNKLLIQKDSHATDLVKEKLALKEMEERLLTNKMIKKAAVYVTPKGALHASVSQKKPIARVTGNAGFYIDKTGGTMPLSTSYSARVVLVSGISKEEVEEVYPLLTFITEDPFLVTHIVGVDRLPNGSYEFMTRKEAYTIYFGAPERLRTKWSNYKAFFQKARKDQSLKDYSTINLAFTNQVVCTK